MQLLQDMLPDPKWEQRGGVDRLGAKLTLQRARQLHASIAVRNYGIWVVILTVYGIAGKMDDAVDARSSLALTGLMVALLCVYSIFGWLDWARNQSVSAKFQLHVPTPRHLFEAIAVPLLCFGMIGLLMLLAAMKAWDFDHNSALHLPLLWLLSGIRYLPWLGLTALMMAVGAWLRYRDEVQNGSNQSSQSMEIRS